jgi:hypothetical protein
VDLSAVAAGNDAAGRTRATAATAAEPSGRLGRFGALVATAPCSTNVSADKVQAFEEAGEVLDARSYHVHKAGGDTSAGFASFNAAQGPWLVRRQSFEGLWDHGRRFTYGAVNAGGMGTEGRFGPFCLVVPDPGTPTPDAMAVFPGDSVQRYTTDDGHVDATAATAEATSWDQRGCLAVEELGDEALAAPDEAWPDVVCRPGHYLEVARAGPLPMTGVEEVRLRESFRRTLDVLQARRLRRQPIGAEGDNLVAAYSVVHGWRRARGLVLTDVPDRSSPIVGP